MKKIITISGIIFVLIIINFSGCTTDNDFIGSWKMIERFGDPPMPGVTTTWTFYDNGTYIGTTTSSFDTVSVWSTYEIRDDQLYTSTVGTGVPLNYKYEFVDGGNTLKLYSLFQEDQVNPTAILERM